MLLVGSQSCHMERPSKDLDYIATPSELEEFKKLNESRIVLAKPSKFGETIFMTGSMPVEVDTSETAQSLINIVLNNELYWATTSGDWGVTPEVLLAMKLTHRYLKNSPHFHKTMRDIHFLRREGYVVPDVLKDWMKERQKATYTYKHPSLNRTKAEFFSDDGVGYIYDHDAIHESVKTFDRPAFELIREDAADVFCSKDRFFSLPENLRLATVIEETYTLALERSQIPNNFTIDRRRSFLMALEKVCTSISSGWWREYAWENYYAVEKMYDENYVDKFKTALSKGMIKPYVE